MVNEKLISVILSAFGFPEKNTGISSDDVSVITDIAARQNILPVIVEGLKNLGRSDLLTEKLVKSEAKSVYDYTQRKVSLDELSKAFEQASISYIPLKGSVIRDYYQLPWMRTSSDIDVLIHDEDIDIATQVLQANTDFKYLRRDRHDVHFVNKYVHLELHFSFEYSVDKIDKALANPWEYVLTSTESCECHFTPEYNLFYNVTHAAKHFIQDGGIGIRPILDLYVMRTHTVFDEDLVKSLCNNAGVLGFYNQCCKLIDVWFNGDSHDEVSKCFEEVVINGGVFGTQRLKIVKNKRNDAGKNYIGRRVFKTSDEIKRYFPKSRKHPILVPFYQVVRWKRMLTSDKSKKYISEFKIANSIDQSEVDKYDKLLKSMGL